MMQQLPVAMIEADPVGLAAAGEKRFSSHIVYGVPDVFGKMWERYADQRVMVVGSGHSAVNALLELAQLKQAHPLTRIYWVMRGTHLQQVCGGGEDNALPACQQPGSRIQGHVDADIIEIVAPFQIREIATDVSGIGVIGETPDGLAILTVDEIITATGEVTACRG